MINKKTKCSVENFITLNRFVYLQYLINQSALLMNLGIISDTHDDLPSLKNAIKKFNENRVSHVIHAGDYVFPGVVKEFKHLNSKLIGIWKQ